MHTFIPISSYLCTVSFGCFETIDRAHPSGIARSDPEKVSLLTAQHLSLRQQSLSIIKSIHASHTSLPSSSQQVIAANKQCSSRSTTNSSCWVKCGTIILTKQDLYLIKNDKELTDQHVNALQNEMKSNFPLIGRLQNTLLQYKSPLQLREGAGLQILHINNRHWLSCHHGSNITACQEYI